MSLSSVSIQSCRVTGTTVTCDSNQPKQQNTSLTEPEIIIHSGKPFTSLRLPKQQAVRFKHKHAAGIVNEKLLGRCILKVKKV